MEDLEALEIKHCPKCGYYAGDDWTQCKGGCPIEESIHYDPAPFYVPRSVPEATRGLNIPSYALYSSVVCSPKIGFFLPARDLRISDRPLNKGTESIPGNFAVFKIEFDHSYKLFISGIDSAKEAIDSIWSYLDACTDLGP